MDTISTAASASFPNLGDRKGQVLKIIIFLLRALGFLGFMVFILCLPLGDPEKACSVEDLCKQDSKTAALTYNYACSVYKVVASTVKYTSTAMQAASEYTGCFVLEALHEAKLKFYNLLSIVDKHDLCRTVCCQDDPDLDGEPTPQQRENKKNCRCKAKCCKRQQQQTP